MPPAGRGLLTSVSSAGRVTGRRFPVFQSCAGAVSRGAAGCAGPCAARRHPAHGAPGAHLAVLPERPVPAGRLRRPARLPGELAALGTAGDGGWTGGGRRLGWLGTAGFGNNF